jgi:hypothetical protein
LEADTPQSKCTQTELRRSNNVFSSSSLRVFTSVYKEIASGNMGGGGRFQIQTFRRRENRLGPPRPPGGGVRIKTNDPLSEGIIWLLSLIYN